MKYHSPPPAMLPASVRSAAPFVFLSATTGTGIIQADFTGNAGQFRQKMNQWEGVFVCAEFKILLLFRHSVQVDNTHYSICMYSIVPYGSHCCLNYF